MQRNYGRISLTNACPQMDLHFEGQLGRAKLRLERLNCSLRRSFPKKTYQLSVHFLRVCPGYTVRPVLHYH
jgi:hypothetical protein